MTCVIGYQTDDTVYIGADSAGTDGYGSQTLRADTKVFKNGPLLFGFCGSYRMGQLLRFKFTPTPQPEGMDDYEYMVKHFIEDARKCLKAGGFTWVEKNTETGGDFLVGYKNKLFHVEEDFQVGISSDDYVAIGSGTDLAMGAMDILTTDVEEMTPTAMIKRALKVAAAHDAYVAPPFVVMKL